MSGDPGVPVTPADVALQTRFTDAVGLPEGEAFSAVFDELEATLARLGIEVTRSELEGELVLRYRCTVEEAFLLRHGAEELAEALTRAYPWLRPSRAELRRRLSYLRSAFEREAAGAGAGGRPPSAERRGRRRSTLG